MTYDIGTHIDLSHIGKSDTAQKDVTTDRSPFEIMTEYEPGTTVLFVNFLPNFKALRPQTLS